jgi:predicted nucleic acid-binding protein
VARNVIERLSTEGDLVDDPQLQVGVTADPGDDYLIALARQSRADCLVSGDSDLLEAGVDDVEILMPAQFLRSPIGGLSIVEVEAPSGM